MATRFPSWLRATGQFLARVYQKLLSPSVPETPSAHAERINRAGRWPKDGSHSLPRLLPIDTTAPNSAEPRPPSA
jgi:hypothetical protein